MAISDDNFTDAITGYIEAAVEERLSRMQAEFEGTRLAIAIMIDHLDLDGAIKTADFQSRLHETIRHYEGRQDPAVLHSLKQTANYLEAFDAKDPIKRGIKSERWLDQILGKDAPDDQK